MRNSLVQIEALCKAKGKNDKLNVIPSFIRLRTDKEDVSYG